MAGNKAFSRIDIGRFRGLRDVTLDGLERFNLIVGGNDSGKTSILEAIGLLCAPLDLAEWATIARMRETMASVPLRTRERIAVGAAIAAVSWFFPRSDDNQELCDVEVNCRGLPYLLGFRASAYEISRFKENPLLTASAEEAQESGLYINISVLPGDATEYKPGFDPWREYSLFPSEGFRSSRRSRLLRTPFMILNPFAHRSEAIQVRNLSRLIEGDYKAELTTVLAMVDKHFRGLDIITSEFMSVPSVIVTHAVAGKVPLVAMGDGFRRAFSIALGLARARGGVLMVDEIESALHVSALETIFPWMLAAAARLDVQIVATTHSLEAVQVIADAGAQDPDNSVVAYHIDPERPAEQRIKRYSNDMLVRLVRDRGLDIRGR